MGQSVLTIDLQSRFQHASAEVKPDAYCAFRFGSLFCLPVPLAPHTRRPADGSDRRRVDDASGRLGSRYRPGGFVADRHEVNLSTERRDALTELLNIAFGRAAASLSRLTGHRVLLEVPEVIVCPLPQLADALRPYVEGDIATVHQVFSGPVQGNAFLVVDQRSGGMLKELLTDEPALPLSIDASAREVIGELGNILLNACLGTFGNLLRVQVSFAVPHVTLEGLEHLVESVIVERQELRYALLVHAAFRLKNSSVSGYLIIVLSVASIERLLKAVDGWIEGPV